MSELYRSALAWAGARLLAERKKKRRWQKKIELSGGRIIRKPKPRPMAAYEVAKRALPADLTPAEYDARIREIVKRTRT